MPTDGALRVLVIDDNVDDADLLMIEFRLSGFRVDWRLVHSSAQATVALQEFKPQLVLSDLNLPGWSGREAYAQVRAWSATVPFLLVTGTADDGEPLPPVDAVVSKDGMASVPARVRELLAGTHASG